MKKKVGKLRLAKETLQVLSDPTLQGMAGGLIASEGPENPCNPTYDFSCSDFAACSCWSCDTYAYAGCSC